MLSVPEKKLVLCLGDIVAVTLSAAAAFGINSLWVETPAGQLGQQLPWVAFLGTVLLIAAYLNDGLDISSVNSLPVFLRRWIGSWLIGVGIYLFIYFLAGAAQSGGPVALSLPRLVPVTCAVVTLFFVPVGRAVLTRSTGIGRQRKSCLIVGAGSACRHFLEEVRDEQIEWDVVGVVDDDPAKLGAEVFGHRVLGNLGALTDLAEKHDVREIVLAVSNNMSAEAIGALLKCFERGIEVIPVANAIERILHRVPIQHLGNRWLPSTFWANSDTPILYRAGKRGMDLVISSSLLLLGLPILAAAMLVTRLSSKGPALYRQVRLGQGGRPFEILKIRTMVADAEKSGPQWASKRDSRITPVGRFFRKSRIDELPQLWNVFRGDMSLVGPRPERPEFVRDLESQIPFYRARLCVRPGITGWAQVKHSYTDTVEGSKMKLEFDLYYVKHRSLLLDLLVIGKTIKTIFLLRGT